MLFSTHKKLLLTIFSITAILGITFFLLRASAEEVWAKFRNHEVFFAEISTPATVEQAPAISSTTPPVATDGAKVPILVYHIVRPSYPTDSKAVKGLAQTPELFAAQMQYLADAGYHVVSYSALEDHLRNGTALPTNPVVITFDDGWGDQFKYAFPILEKHHYTATFFVFTNPIGTRGFMTWDDLRALRDAGMSIGSHSLSHPFLTKITDPEKLWKEIDQSKLTLEKNLGITVTEFAYPFGKYDATTTEMVKKAGYTSARGDYVKKSDPQSIAQIYDLGAMNAPTSIGWFKGVFPAK